MPGNWRDVYYGSVNIKKNSFKGKNQSFKIRTINFT